MRPMKPDKEISVSTIWIPTVGGSIPALVLAPKTGAENAAGVLWIHGGGYIAGMKEMVHASRAVDLVKKFGAVVVSPGYRLAVQRPYPAAAEDCYSALIYMKNHARELGIRRDQIMVGGESAGGGLCAAVCLMARDRASVNIAFQMPLYPMLDDRDTESSRDNHGQVWNTRKNLHGSSTSGARRRVMSPPMPPRQGRRTFPVCRLPIPLWGTENLFTWRRFTTSKR